MTSRTGPQGLMLALLIISSMVIGGVITSLLAGDGSGSESPAVPVWSATATPTANPVAPIAAIQPLDIDDLPDVIEQVIPSVVLVRTDAGVGTGIVIDRQGHILTNYHVIERAGEVRIQLFDGGAGRAEIIGVDPGGDLAVIRASIQPQRLHPAAFGDSDQVRVGQRVFAIGNPFNQNFSVSAGIVSALDRVTTSTFTGRPIRGMIQTDADLNPGNSGGPLFNAAGEVVGINSSIENPNGRFSVGIGFAVPSNTVQRFLPAMLAGEEVHHARLGVSGDQLDEVRAAELALTVDQGVYILSVDPGSAAARAGLRGADERGLGGDVVVEIAGRAVRSFEDLALAIDEQSVGDQVSIIVIRGGQRVELTAVLQGWIE